MCVAGRQASPKWVTEKVLAVDSKGTPAGVGRLARSLRSRAQKAPAAKHVLAATGAAEVLGGAMRWPLTGKVYLPLLAVGPAAWLLPEEERGSEQPEPSAAADREPVVEIACECEDEDALGFFPRVPQGPS